MIKHDSRPDAVLGGVSSEDEAIYITALINSPAVIDVIVEHQPRGAFGERSSHSIGFLHSIRHSRCTSQWLVPPKNCSTNGQRAIHKPT